MKVFLQANGVLSDKRAPQKKNLHQRVAERRKAHPIRYRVLPRQKEDNTGHANIDIDALASKIAKKLSVFTETQFKGQVLHEEFAEKKSKKFIPMEEREMKTEISWGKVKKSFTKLGEKVKTTIKPTDLSNVLDK